ncbi:hypothetical protein [Plastoroseomonas arctica]|uniref:Uncharacterized protein n=1 Tax=Plastoroseomonas arctica TaxID=1509237 RepID=A0AAF1JUE6_9PROT|nr:hypothetical protein [Plastoroseomonas arctica]MBR0653851.1 hypothetical protein [Plastoroseomonas arctica]
MMPTQVTTTRGANVQALVQKSQARALPRTPRAEHAGQQPGAQGTQASGAPAQDFRAMLQRMEGQRQERVRGIAQ